MPTPVKIPAEVENIIQHAVGVKSFILRPLKSCPNFKPGQFMHLAIDKYDPSFHWPESRVFSIATSPSRRNKLRITFSVKGMFTQRMYESVKERDILWLKLPYGSFTLNNDEREIILIAGGTGLTPFVSFLEYAIDNKREKIIILYYGVRRPEYIIFDSLLKECKFKLKNFKCNIFIESKINMRSKNKINMGTLSIDKIIEDTIGKTNQIYYLSGPHKMILSFAEELRRSGIKANNIMIDEW